MKPVRLEMEAFGPYAEHTVIDFEQLDSGLFLITGNTGSGKTMIFDAVCYALFGKVSGDRRSANMLWSDLSEGKPWVRLVFDHRGERYTVYREPPYKRVNRNGNVTDGKTVSELYRGDELLPFRNREVDGAVADIIGMDADQWKQTSMLAQGEFVKLLDTDSKRRTDILRKVFDTDRYKYLQNKLEELAKARRQEYETLKGQIEGRLSDAVLPEGTDTSRMTTDEVRGAIMSMVEADSSEAGRLGELRIRSNAALEEAIKEHTLAVSVDQDFDRLEQSRAELAGIDAEGDEIRALALRRERAGNIAPLVSLEDGLRTKERDLEVVMEELSSAEKAAERARADRDITAAARGIAARDESEARGLAPACDRIERSLPDYDRADGISREIGVLETDVSLGTARLEEIAGRIGSLRNESEELAGRIEAAGDTGAALEAVKREAETAEKELEGIRSLREEAIRCIDIVDELTATEMVFNSADAKHRELSAKADEWESLILRSQAGILAASLEDGVPCPVCGSVHHPSPATVPEDVPTEADLKKLRKRRDSEADRRSEAASNIASLRAELDGRMSRITAFTGSGGVPGDQADLLDGMFADAQERLAEAGRRSVEAELLHKTTIASRTALAANSETMTGLDAEERNIRTGLESTRVRLGSLKAELGSISGRLEYPDAAAARLALESNRRRMAETAEALRVADARAIAAETELARIGQAVDGFRARGADLEPAIEKDRRDLEAMLAERGMTLEELNGLRSLDLAAINARLEDHAGRLKSCTDRIAELEASLEGRERPDLEAAASKVEGARAALAAVDDELNTVNVRKKVNTDVLRSLDAKWAEAERLEISYTEIDRMSDVANGKLAGARKVQFEQYIQREYFRRVLTHTNKRLSDMTGGRFELTTHDEGDNRSQNALDIDVMDRFTGKVRNVKSLSGGESFTAALALALGLSDSVQMGAGGARVETLFIDEGFGSLDTSSLQEAVRVLEDLTEGDRMVGVISHVDMLRERIDRKVIVTREKDSGSRVKVVTD